MTKKIASTAGRCAICKLPITEIRNSCVQIQSGRRAHLECHQRDAIDKEQARLKGGATQPYVTILISPPTETWPSEVNERYGDFSTVFPVPLARPSACFETHRITGNRSTRIEHA